MLADAILVSAKVPVHPTATLTACNNAVVGVPVNASVTLVSSVFVNAAGVTVGIVGNVAKLPSPLIYCEIVPVG